jgi:ABC-type Fe3+/spermidine/putrescine transport system ATPase subunit
MKKLILLFLLSGFFSIGQTKNNSKSKTYISRKQVYEIKYNPEHWIKTESTNWDAEFHDKYNLVNAYFIEDKYKEIVKIKNLKNYKKKINTIEVNYFECELNYNDYLYKYQGFIYNGKGGSIQIQYGAQAEAITQNQNIIDELNNGISIIN